MKGPGNSLGRAASNRAQARHRPNSRLLRDACRAAPGAALACGIVSSTTLAAPGDLDPGFGDVGRFVLPDFLGAASSLAKQDDSVIVAGGDLLGGGGLESEVVGSIESS